ncbi:MAG: glutamate--tRNA ligase [Bacteroidota bacterium]
MSRRVRTRFAPSPTGPLHMGGVRTALFCYLFAKKHGGDFILRIEDTDQNRFVPGAEEYIIEALKWCGISPNEGIGFGDGAYGPYRQSERKPMYKQYAEQLIEAGYAYYAFDSAEEIEQMRENMTKQGVQNPSYNSVTRQYMKNSVSLSADEVKARLANGEPYVIRHKMPRNEEIKFHDLIHGWVSFNSSQIDDKVLLKADGMPTYHLAHVVDDYTMKISHAFRGDEWLPSAPTHIHCVKGLGWEKDIWEYAHFPLILKPDGKGKLSKRDGDRLGFPSFPINWTDPATGDLSIGYRERGFFPEAFVNMLAFLGWNPGTEQEIFSIDELIQAFTIDRVHKAGARFDFDKTKWFNQQYLKDKSNAELAELIAPQLAAKNYNASNAFIQTFCGMIKERATFINDFSEMGYYFFEDVKTFDEITIKKKWKIERNSLFEELNTELLNDSTFNASSIEHIVKEFMGKNALGMGDVGPILRIAITGTMQGPPIFELMELLGKEIVEKRIKIAFEKFNSLV